MTRLYLAMIAWPKRCYMTDFFAALTNPSIPFVRNALIAAILSAILFGVLGAIVTVRRIAGLAGAISHAVLGGIGLALYLAATGLVPNLPPIAGAIVFAQVSINGAAAEFKQAQANAEGIARFSTGCLAGSENTISIDILDVYYEGYQWDHGPCDGGSA